MATADDIAAAEAIGARLRAKIVEAKESPESIARALGVVNDTVYRMLRGETILSWLKLLRLAAILRTSPDDLLGIASGYNPDTLQSTLSAAFEAIGLPPEEARQYAAVVIAALDTPPSQRQGLSEGAYARIQIAAVKSLFARR